MDPAVRNFKDFLQLYNQIVETCFSRCVNNFCGRSVETDEVNCMDICLNKHIKTNHKIMGHYVEVQTQIVNRRVQEMNEANEK